MADFSAIAAVSRTLRRLLSDRIVTPGVAVTLTPPDIAVAGINGSRVNLYLFQVEEAVSLRNQAVPGAEHRGTFGQPPLSLVLRYLLTSHARSEDQPDSDLIAQTLLGDAMLALHDFGGRIEELALVTNRVGAIGDRLIDSVLENEFERVKLTLQQSSLDDLNKLWSAMPEANYRRSVVYEISVVQIEGRRPRTAAPPVALRRIAVTASRAPVIVDAYLRAASSADAQRDRRIGIGDMLVIEHQPVAGDHLYVRLGDLEPIRVIPPLTGRIEIAIPDAQYPSDPDHPVVRPIPSEARLLPGALAVSLVAPTETEGVEGALDRGARFAEERALGSNVALLQLVPIVSAISPTNGDASAIVRVTGRRLWDEDLASRVVIGGVALPVRPPGPGDGWAAPTETAVEMPASAIAAFLEAGAPPYPVAIEVNGSRNRESGFTFRLDP